MTAYFKYLSGLAAFTLAYLFFGRLGLMLSYADSHITLIWLPTGIAVYALLRGGLKYCPSIFLGALLVNLSIDPSIFLSLSIASGNTIAPIITYLILKNFDFSLSLGRNRDIALLIFSAAIGMILSASCGMVSLFNAGLVSQAGFVSSWMTWWAGDAIGVLIALPLMLNVTKQEVHRLWKARVSFLLSGVFVLLIEILAFKYSNGVNGLFFTFLIVPMVILISMRFGLTGGSLVVLSLSVVAVLETVGAQGPFYQVDLQQGIISLWIFMSVLTLIPVIINIMQSERLAFELALQRSEAKLRAIVNGALDAIVSINEQGEIIEFNQAAERIFGYQRQEVIGKALDQVIIPPSTREQHKKGHQDYIDTGERRIFDQRLELVAMRADGTEFPVELTLTSFKGQGVRFVTGFIRDITARKNAEEEINQLAFYESLTGLPNRRLFMDRLGQAFAHTAREGCYGAVIFVDLDHFKSLNDTRGHEVGDKLLIQVAERIKKQVRSEDTISRLGGDEFVILLTDLGHDQEAAILSARQIAELLLHTIDMPYNLNGFEHYSSSSLGVCLWDTKLIRMSS